MVFITQEKEIQMALPRQVLYFYAPWMVFHAKYLEMMRQEETTATPFFAIDVNSFPNQCRRFNVQSIPTIIMFKNGQQFSRLEGKITVADFKNFLA
jgi:thioredoxin-like negative regulator of GroEL